VRLLVEVSGIIEILDNALLNKERALLVYVPAEDTWVKLL